MIIEGDDTLDLEDEDYWLKDKNQIHISKPLFIQSFSKNKKI